MAPGRKETNGGINEHLGSIGNPYLIPRNTREETRIADRTGTGTARMVRSRFKAMIAPITAPKIAVAMTFTVDESNTNAKPTVRMM
jgi:hypothetical protein